MKHNFYILEVIDPHTHKEWAIDAMEEVGQLIKTYGGEIIGESVQHAVHPHPGTYIGSGKLTQLIEEVKSKKIDVVVINDLVKSGQLFRLEKALWPINPHIQVWDKVDLILRIFEKHATSTQAKLQIQLALIDHLGPRAYGLGGNVLSRQGAGIGTRGKGETNIEIERRRSRRIRQELVAKLAKIAKQHSNHIAQRKSKGVFTVALVGYTSAGKTTLFNQLTKKNKTTSQQLFTTLDSITGRINPRTGKTPILISDTIGFIKDLPPSLLETFRSTLEESIYADLILEVIDGADEHWLEKHQIVAKVLESFNVQGKIITLINKTDLLSLKKQQDIAQKIDQNTLFISAKNNKSIDKLRSKIAGYIKSLS